MNVLTAHRYRQNGSREKTLGSVYTPPRVAAALVRWAVRSPDDTVLDPACGEGVFLSAAQTRLADLGNTRPVCVGVDIDPFAAGISGAICRDFFEWISCRQHFDVVVGNPPFVRSHLFPEPSRQLAFACMREMGLHPSRLMSTWAPFVALSCNVLSESGRLALVVPEELLHVSYARELRNFLLSRFRRVIVSFPAGVFPSVQQAVVLLLCDNEVEGQAGLQMVSFDDLEHGPPYRYASTPPWDWSHKWTHLFLSQEERHFVSASFAQLGWKSFKDYGRVEVGVVTGLNEFFILKKAVAEQIGAPFLSPIVSSARDVKGISLSPGDFALLVQAGRPTFLVSSSKGLEELPEPLRRYLEQGQQLGVNNHYKCRTREPWYAVPSVWPADALLLRQAGDFPRLIHLSQRCASTDTIHRVRWGDRTTGKRLVAGFLNTWTLIACEITGRSYGGGVLELMPSEANRLPLPPPIPQLEVVFDDIDQLVRSKRLQEAIARVDSIVTPISIPPDDLQYARNTLRTLVTRRKQKNGRHC